MLSKPRLLIFCDWFEPGYKAGGPVRSIVNLVKTLENDLEIYIFTSDRECEIKSMDEVWSKY